MRETFTLVSFEPSKGSHRRRRHIYFKFPSLSVTPMFKRCINSCPTIKLHWLVAGFVGALLIVCYQLSASFDQQLLTYNLEFLQNQVCSRRFPFIVDWFQLKSNTSDTGIFRVREIISFVSMSNSITGWQKMHHPVLDAILSFPWFRECRTRWETFRHLRSRLHGDNRSKFVEPKRRHHFPLSYHQCKRHASPGMEAS